MNNEKFPHQFLKVDNKKHEIKFHWPKIFSFGLGWSEWGRQNQFLLLSIGLWGLLSEKFLILLVLKYFAVNALIS